MFIIRIMFWVYHTVRIGNPANRSVYVLYVLISGSSVHSGKSTVEAEGPVFRLQAVESKNPKP